MVKDKTGETQGVIARILCGIIALAYATFYVQKEVVEIESL